VTEPAVGVVARRPADYSMYSTFLTASPGSVLFSRSNLLKRKDLYFSCLRLGLIRHRRSLRSSHLFSSGLTRFRRVTTREADILVKRQSEIAARAFRLYISRLLRVVVFFGWMTSPMPPPRTLSAFNSPGAPAVLQAQPPSVSPTIDLSDALAVLLTSMINIIALL
jgi:hypothetical protein